MTNNINRGVTFQHEGETYVLYDVGPVTCTATTLEHASEDKPQLWRFTRYEVNQLVSKQ